MEAICITLPHFDLGQVGDCWYTKDEIRLINQLAIAYVENGQEKQGFFVYRQLLDSLQSEGKPQSQYQAQFIMVSYNCARALNVAQRYEEAARVARWEACVSFVRYQFLPGLLAILANCSAHIGDFEQSRECYLRAYYLYCELKEEENLLHLRQDAMDTLHLELPAQLSHSIG